MGFTMHCEDISELLTPCLLIDKKRLMSNIDKMSQKAKDCGVTLRPHIKTHKCTEIAALQKKNGSSGITVSTLDEASIFADAGFDDITYAVPISSNKMPAAQRIAEHVDLKLIVDSHHAVKALEEKSKKNDIVVEVLMKVDCGYHRCGVNPESHDSIKLVQRIVESSHLRFKGILTHAGHSYNAKTPQQVKEIVKQEQEVMVKFARKLEHEERNLKPEIVSIGSTPTMSVTDKIMEGITEIRPGNYVFYDYSQVQLGSCRLNDCALTTLARVIGRYNHHFVIDAGATSLSKDLGLSTNQNENEFGKIYQDYENDLLESSLGIRSISQEHGKVQVTDPSILERFHIDAMTRILPNHSCLTANLHDYYYIVEGSKIVDKWRIRKERPITSACS